MPSRYFADLSDNNTFYDPRAYADAGPVMIGLKCTEGETVRDTAHAARCVHSRPVNLLVMHYHFARPDLGTNPFSEAEFFYWTVKPHWNKHDMWCVDYERLTGRGLPADRVWVRAFELRARELLGKEGVLYANRSMLATLGPAALPQGGRTWEADWSSHPEIHLKGEWAWARQFASSGFGPQPHSLPGVGAVDIDLINPRTYATIRALRASRQI
jgi:hypothetical protein